MRLLYSQALMPRDHWSQKAEKTVDLTLKDSTLLWETVVLLCKCRTPHWESGPWK